MSHITPVAFDIESLLTQFNADQWFDRYWQALSEENQKVNLVSRETTTEKFRRIVAEALVPFAQSKSADGRYLDIGSGGGIPAVPLILSGVTTGSATLYERTKKKALALNRICSKLRISDCNVVVESFGENQPKHKFDLVTLSWVTLTPDLFRSIEKVMAPNSKLIYYSKPIFEIPGHTVSIFSYSQTPADIHKYFSIITK